MQKFYVGPRLTQFNGAPDKRWWRKGKVISGFEAMVKYPDMFKMGPVNAKPWSHIHTLGLSESSNRLRRALRNELEKARIEKMGMENGN